MQIRITKPGMLSTVQDMGRHTYVSQAVPVSGAMDMLSARLANKAVGNADGDAVIEFTYAGAEFTAETDILMAYMGDGVTLTYGGKKLPSDRPVFVPKGNTINLVSNPQGSRTYLAVAGGWDVPEVLGSRSTYITAGFGGFNGRALQLGDVLKSRVELSMLSQSICGSLKGLEIKYTTWNLGKRHLLSEDRKTIRVVPGHEFTWFDGMSLIDFLSEHYTLSLNSNRMGYHLEGAIINRSVQKELLSTAVVPGTIQVTGNGNLVLLMADCQTTGGYPRIGQVAAVDMPLCGQLKPGDTINFKEMSRDEAESLYIEQERELERLTAAVRNRYLL